MEIRINDYSDSFTNLEKMIESIADLDQVVAICLGRITFFKKKTWWDMAIEITFGIILGLLGVGSGKALLQLIYQIVGCDMINSVSLLSSADFCYIPQPEV